MVELSQLKCAACHSDEPSLPDAEFYRLHREIPQWEINEVTGVKRLARLFRFKNFAQTMQFINRVGTLAEAENHHPLVIWEYATITLNLWTHKVNGLHMNDFIMAAKMEKIYKIMRASDYHYLG